MRGWLLDSSHQAPETMQRGSSSRGHATIRMRCSSEYSVDEVAARLVVSTHSLYKWVKAASPGQSAQHFQELLEAKSEIMRLPS